MAGANVFVFTGTEFVPTNRALTAALSRVTPTASISYAHTLYPSRAQIWQGYPPTPNTPTVAYTQPGTYPNKANSVAINWTITSSGLTANQNVYLKIGTGAYTKVGVNVGASTTSYTVGNIPANTDYTLYVESVSYAGLTRTSSPVTANIAGAGAIATFTGAAASSSQVDFTWTTTANQFQRFYVRYSSDNSNWGAWSEVASSLTATSFSSSVTGLSYVTTRYAQVYGVDYNGYSSATLSTSATSSSTTPADPTSPTISAGDRTITATWTLSANDGGSAIDYYYVTLNRTSDEVEVASAVKSGATATSHVFSVTNGNDYKIRVIAHNANGYSAWSAWTGGATGTFAAPYIDVYAPGGDAANYYSSAPARSFALYIDPTDCAAYEGCDVYVKYDFSDGYPSIPTFSIGADVNTAGWYWQSSAYYALAIYGITGYNTTYGGDGITFKVVQKQTGYTRESERSFTSAAQTTHTRWDYSGWNWVSVGSRRITGNTYVSSYMGGCNGNYSISSIRVNAYRADSSSPITSAARGMQIQWTGYSVGAGYVGANSWSYSASPYFGTSVSTNYTATLGVTDTPFSDSTVTGGTVRITGSPGSLSTITTTQQITAAVELYVRTRSNNTYYY